MGSCQTSKGGPTTPGGWTEAKSSCDFVASSGVCRGCSKTYLIGFDTFSRVASSETTWKQLILWISVMLGRQGWLFSSSDCWAGYDHSMFTTPSFYRGDLQAEGASSQNQVGQCSWGAATLPRDGKGAMLTSFNVQRLTSPDLTSQTEVYFSQNNFKLVKYCN